MTFIPSRSRRLACRRTAAVKVQAAVDAPQPAEPQQSADAERYTGSDGRPKATFEQAFRVGHGDYGGQKMPWQLSWQRNERSLKFTDAINEHMVKVGISSQLHPRLHTCTHLDAVKVLTQHIMQQETAESAPRILLRAQGFAVKELHISEDEMEHRLQQLSLLLPDLAAKISVMKPKVTCHTSPLACS